MIKIERNGGFCFKVPPDPSYLGCESHFRSNVIIVCLYCFCTISV